VVLSAGGATAVTDDAGEYEFPSLKPDVYALQVDLGSAGVGRVTVVPAPFLVTVLGGEEARVDIGVVPASSVAGEFTVYEFTEAARLDTAKGDLIPAGKASGLLVELSGGGGVFRSLTDSRGRFRFNDLRPGTWVLRVATGGLPAYHYLERDSVRFTVFPRTHIDTTFRVLPKRRTIRMIDEGTIRQGVTPGGTASPPKTLHPLRLSGRHISLACWRVEVRACRDVSPGIAE